MRAVLAAVAVLALAGCGTPNAQGRAFINGFESTANQLQLADGTPAWLINCPNVGVGVCLTRASAVCPAGYRLLDRNVADGGAQIGATPQALYGRRRVDYEVIVSCNEPAS